MQSVTLKIMRTISVMAAALLLGVWVHAADNGESFIRKTFTVAPGGKLMIHADRGSINVKAGASDKVEIEVTREPGRGASDDILKKHQVTFFQDGNDVSVKAELEGARKGWFNNGNNLRVKYEVSVPSKYNVNLKTSGGTIAVTGLEGDAKAETSGGGLKFAQINGPIYGRTSGGSIDVSGSAKDVDVETSGGGIHVGDAAGSVVARTSGGSIKLGQIKGAITAETSGGGIDVNGAAGPVRAHTSGGSIHASLSDQPAGACTFETSGGGIDLKLAEKVAIDLDAHTSGGSVSTDLPVTVQGTMKHNELRSKVNGGGPKLTLETSGGSIHIRKL
jgi:DUF4097 and DUF4098 domain-containing protein YvlB